MKIKYINEKEINFNLQNIHIKGFNNLSQIYSFTTEKLSGYFEKLDLKDKNVLTVAASGDHIINAFYKGAKIVTGFDINYLALIFTELKLVAIQNLEYEDFLKFFMINELNDIDKNKEVLNYDIYIELKKYLSQNATKTLNKMYEHFNNNGYELRNSYLFNNKYDYNKVKVDSNLYLKSKLDYNIAREKIREKEINLVNSSYQNITLEKLPNTDCYDIILMSNISDYIKNIYNINTNYLEEYIKEIMQNFKRKNNRIVCAYLYDIQNTKCRSDIDNPALRKNVFDKLNIPYTEEKFKSVINNCLDSVLII